MLRSIRFPRPGVHDGDRGASTVEYAGLVRLAAVLVTALTSSGS